MQVLTIILLYCLWLSFVKRILRTHVRQDDPASHSAFRGGTAQPLKVLVHAILPERRLYRASCSSAQEVTAILPLQHLHLKKRKMDKQREREHEKGIELNKECKIEKVVMHCFLQT